jgi:hypothetical protein
MMAESQWHEWMRLVRGNGSVNMFPLQSNHLTAATTEELLEAVLSMQSTLKLYTMD